MACDLNTNGKRTVRFEETYNDENLPPEKKVRQTPKSSVRIPLEVLETILQNIQSACSATNEEGWSERCEKIEAKAYVTVLFNRITGKMNFSAHGVKDENEEGINFVFASDKSFIFNRNKLTQDFNDKKKGLTIIAAKILLTMELLLSDCHTYGFENINSPQGTTERKFFGTLKKDQLEDFLKDETKIQNIWEEQVCNLKHYRNKLHTTFLVGLLYEENRIDEGHEWDSTWGIEDVLTKEVLVTKRSSGELRFCRVEVLDQEKVKKDHVQINLGGGLRNMSNTGENPISKLVLKRW